MSDIPDRLYERLLVLRCQGGDEIAFEELVGRYSAKLRYYLAKMRGGNHVDDLLQEVWLDVFRSVSRLNDPGAFPAWVYRIARDRIYRELRRKRLPTSPMDGVEVPDDAGDEEFTAEDVQRVQRALDELPHDHREALVLRFVEQMSYEQIATVVGCPAGTVRSRLFYAKAALKNQLQRENPP